MALTEMGDTRAVPDPRPVVLDTNVALDLLAFGDPRVSTLAAAIEDDRLLWLASAYMRQEIAFVLTRAALARYKFAREGVLERFDRWSRLVPEGAPDPRLRCRDRRDQPFLDLALATRAACLLTHDRDLLCLARRALPLGLRIVTPMAWAAAPSGGHGPAS